MLSKLYQWVYNAEICSILATSIDLKKEILRPLREDEEFRFANLLNLRRRGGSRQIRDLLGLSLNSAH